MTGGPKTVFDWGGVAPKFVLFSRLDRTYAQMRGGVHYADKQQKQAYLHLLLTPMSLLPFPQSKV